MSMVTVRRRGGASRPRNMEYVGRTSLSYERTPSGVPGWLIEKAAQKQLTADYTARNTKCPQCFCLRSNTDVCVVCE